MVASTSGGAGGATPSNSSSLAIEISVFVQVADDEFSSLSHFRTHRQRTQLPREMVGECRGFGEEVLERRPLDLFHLAAAAIAGIEILLKERAKIDFFERIFLFRRGDRIFFA